MNYETLASEETLTKIIGTLAGRNVEATIVKDRAEAMAKIKELIPKGTSVMNGSSRTLEEIGYIDYLKLGTHGWDNLHEAVLAETDKEKQARLRKLATLSDYYLGSVHGLAETGEFVIGSNTGSQMPHIAYSSPNLIFVVGAQKVMPTLEGAMLRLIEHVVPLEDQNMQQKYKMGTKLNKVIQFTGESKFTGRKVRMILVQEKLGF